jgi:hypothetical protein
VAGRAVDGRSLAHLTEVDLSLLGLVRRIGARAARPAVPLGCTLAELSDRELEALARGVLTDPQCSSTSTIRPSTL